MRGDLSLELLPCVSSPSNICLKKKHPGVTGDASQESAVASYYSNLLPQIKWRNNNLTEESHWVAFVCVYRQQLTVAPGQRVAFGSKAADLGAPGKSEKNTTTAPSGGRFQ